MKKAMLAATTANGDGWWRLGALLFGLWLAAAGPAQAEDGYELWLRCSPLPAAQADEWRDQLQSLVVSSDSDTAKVIRQELQRGL
ncbi:MAG: hypothetical protein KDI56_13375, partial [Xanthomonadales bacterium]|nr:hypothetical protein [Xanthomonadales bacterium]